jgi:thiamine pyrophosphate-dependent acetolactate synthase large subunit-like protein
MKGAEPIAEYPIANDIPDVFGICGAFAANEAGRRSDLVIAIGAKLATPDRPVVAVTGDGCFATVRSNATFRWSG